MAGEQSGEATSGKATGTPLPNDLVQLANQVQAAQNTIESIAELTERSIVGEIDNLTEKRLTLVGVEHSSGGLGRQQPEPKIDPLTNRLFTSKNKAPFQGTVGSVTYRSDDGTEFVCGWSNPFIGDGTIRFETRGAHPARYGVFATPSAGNTGALRRWIIFVIPGPFSVKQFLRAHRVNRILAIRDAKGSTVRRLMGL